MTTGTLSDFKIYDDQFFGGMVETLTQFSTVFNEASNNALRVVTNMQRGQYAYESFMQNISGLVTRRDPTSMSAASKLKLTQAEMVSVKCNRKIGPVSNTLDSFRKILESADQESFSFLLGTQIAKAVEVEYVDTMLNALGGALLNISGLVTRDSTSKLSTDKLVTGLSKFGDSADKIGVFVMHSKPYYDLVKNQISSNITGVANFNVATATPVTLNRPVIVTDSASLIYHPGGSNDADEYLTLGLTAGAAIIEESEERMIFSDIIGGGENLELLLQGEYAYNLGLKGLRYDVSSGGANPNATAIGTGTNWDTQMASNKSLPGVLIRTI